MSNVSVNVENSSTSLFKLIGDLKRRVVTNGNVVAARFASEADLLQSQLNKNNLDAGEASSINKLINENLSVSVELGVGNQEFSVQADKSFNQLVRNAGSLIYTSS